MYQGLWETWGFKPCRGVSEGEQQGQAKAERARAFAPRERETGTEELGHCKWA